jgi:hypothetical protein
MTDITQNNDNYPAAIYQIAVTDPVLGGAGGIANKAAAALADRTAYQRMRNVTPWVPGLDQPYPAHAYVQRSGLTYKSLAANANVDPATPAAAGIWERWAYTESEMYAFLKNNHGGDCPVTGPATAPTLAAPWTKYRSIAPYLENWEWNGLSWGVTSNHYLQTISIFPGAMPTPNTWMTLVALNTVRAGKVFVSGVASHKAGASAGLVIHLSLIRQAGVDVNESTFKSSATGAAELMIGRPQTYLTVTAGQSISIAAYATSPVVDSNPYGSALTLKYL